MTIQTRIGLAAALVLAASTAQAAVTFDANIEADPTFTGSRNKPATKSDSYLGGRVEINANAALMKQGDNFANARASLIVPLNGDSVTIDDAWVQVGNSKVDFKLGRQEAADLFPLGKDTVVESANSAIGYKANTLRGRMKDGRIHSVIGLNAGPGLRAELGLATKKNGSGSAHGLRPTLVYTNGPLAVRFGVESFKTEGKTNSSVTGVGLSVGYALNKDTNINANYARASKLNASSFGLNATIGAAGIGYINDRNTLLNTKVNTVYAAYTFPLFNVKGATITPAISHSTGTGVDSATAVRFRINYAF